MTLDLGGALMARLLGAMAAEHPPSTEEGSQIPNSCRKMRNKTEIPAPTSANIPTGWGTQDPPPTHPSLGIGQGGQAGNAANEGISADQCLSSPNE